MAATEAGCEERDSHSSVPEQLNFHPKVCNVTILYSSRSFWTFCCSPLEVLELCRTLFYNSVEQREQKSENAESLQQIIIVFLQLVHISSG